MSSPAGSRILIADDEPGVLSSLQAILTSAGHQVSTAGSGPEALRILRREPIELLISDLQMPGMDGLALTRRVIREWPQTPVVILTADGSLDSAVESMRLGAADFLVKPLDPEELLVRIAKRLEERQLRADFQRLSSEVRRTGGYQKIIGVNREMREIFAVIEKVAGKPSVVLIEGEPGTGKELVARALHDKRVALKMAGMAHRSPEIAVPEVSHVQYPWVAVNCGAIPGNLLESALFGHKKGAFTGATADQEGFFVAARHGTLFLDEITELDFDLQVKLLRAIQERQVIPLGCTRPVEVHARIITATNQLIKELVSQGRFRAELFWRINVVNIRVPPLRDRVDDIPLLVAKFLESIAKDYGVAPRKITPQVLQIFQSYHWPGNVRELENVIERA
ncbi:MAG: sigma-54 dependent transcriptional regulator, partial [Planctomycetota bacterium]